MSEGIPENIRAKWQEIVDDTEEIKFDKDFPVSIVFSFEKGLELTFRANEKQRLWAIKHGYEIHPLGSIYPKTEEEKNILELRRQEFTNPPSGEDCEPLIWEAIYNSLSSSSGYIVRPGYLGIPLSVLGKELHEKFFTYFADLLKYFCWKHKLCIRAIDYRNTKDVQVVVNDLSCPESHLCIPFSMLEQKDQ